MPLKIHNSLTRRKEDFAPLDGRRVGMYVCGPTVYGHSHIGHAKSYVSFDLIVRYLRSLGYNVTYVQNITDVGHLSDDADEGEDKVERQSRKDRIHPMQLVEIYTRSYFEDMDALNVVRPDISPRATGHVIEQIELVKSLLARGYAYEAAGSVYFDVSKDAEYGKLSGRSTAEAEAGTRVEVNPDKRHPNDFALWKKADAGHIMQWPSPWGMGFPGWHLECSAMSMKYLGESFDIHGGGIDNQFPHHECEIAQSECSTGKPFVRFWIHNNLVTVGGQKMGKSLGNVIMLKDIFKQYPPLVMRFFILQSHYRSTLDFTTEALDGAAKGFEKLLNTVRSVRRERDRKDAPERSSAGKIDVAAYRQSFLDAMNDDFNSPQAIAVLFDLSREVNNHLGSGGLDPETLLQVDQAFGELGGKVLGVIPERVEEGSGGERSIEPELIELLIGLRSEIRAQKLWALSDKIRDGLQKAGIVLEDHRGETTWRRSP